MTNFKQETENRISFIKKILNASGMNKIVFANSGGKDAALTGILCKMACEDTLGLILPCSVKRNFTEDKNDALRIAKQFSIESREIDLSPVKELLLDIMKNETAINNTASTNIAPRLRMVALYTVSAAEGRLVAGTSNKSEFYLGYFTKWGDGAYDFNPVGDLTATEIYEYLRYFNVPEDILCKPPSGGLYEGQTDEQELGVSYEIVDNYIKTGSGNEKDIAIIENFHKTSSHKRAVPVIYSNIKEMV